MDKVRNTSSNKSRRQMPFRGETDAETATGDVPLDLRYSMIAIAAYYKAEQRGFAAGSAMEDWLAAETEIEQLLKSS